MIFRILADLVVVSHLGFVLFVLAGAAWVRSWPPAVWVHLPAVAWAAGIEFGGWVCPLTPLENWLRGRAGESGYPGGFVEHYLIAILYPDGLTPALRAGLGIGVILVNAALYARIVMFRKGGVP